MATITQSEFDVAYIRRSAEDWKRVLDALKSDGTLTIEADEAPPDPEVARDADGNEMKDEDGNPVHVWQPVDIPTDLSLAIDNIPDEGEPKIPENIVVEVAPGTQNAAAPFPEDEEGRKSGKRGRSRETQGTRESKES